MYDNHLCLAMFFTEPKDKWLKHHFFQLALQSARKIKIDSGKREAEANLHMGQIYLENGKNMFTVLHFVNESQCKNIFYVLNLMYLNLG